MKKILCALLFLAMLMVPVMGLVGTALVDDDAVIMNLLPDKNTDAAHLKVEGCEVSYGPNGEVIFTLTAEKATITYTMMENGVLYAGSNVDLNNDAFCAVDYGTAGEVKIHDLIFHYTRKDKKAENKVADLYLASMVDKKKYGEYQAKFEEQKGLGTYVVWDWGKYVKADADKKLFDDKIHNFTTTELTLDGKPGGQITFYTAAITNTSDLPGLGDDRPEPISVAESSDLSGSEEDPSAAASEESSAAVSEASSDVSEESSETSSKDTSSKATSSATTSSKAPVSSSAATSSESADEGGLPVGAIVGIVCAVVAVIAVVVVVVLKKKKG